MLADPEARALILGADLQTHPATTPSVEHPALTPAISQSGFGGSDPARPQRLHSTDLQSEDWEEEQLRRYRLPGIVEGIVEGSKQYARERYTDLWKWKAKRAIIPVIEKKRTSPLARAVLKKFLSGERDRAFYFGPESEGVRELFNTSPGRYYRREEVEAMRYLAYEKYKTGDLREGYAAKEIRPSAPFVLEAYGLHDGVQLGDVTGTLTNGIDAWVKDGRVHFRAVNEMTLVSFGVGNVIRLQNDLLIPPSSGPFSTVKMTYEWSRPIPNYLTPKRR